jgi:hypothetical protein
MEERRRQDVLGKEVPQGVGVVSDARYSFQA